jgi:hypothetical protein
MVIWAPIFDFDNQADILFLAMCVLALGAFVIYGTIEGPSPKGGPFCWSAIPRHSARGLIRSSMWPPWRLCLVRL